MEEIITYFGEGDQEDKHGDNSVGYSTSLHSSSRSHAYKHANSHPHGAASTGFLTNDRVFVAVKRKALIQVYVHGKEAPIQNIPVPEQLSALALTNCQNSHISIDNYLPWLLIGGSVSGKLYVWELKSGLLLFTKTVHYQQISKISFSSNNKYLVTASQDTRAIIFNVRELLANSPNIKPVATISDHSREITDFKFLEGLNNDTKLVTVSLDSTCRIYQLTTGKLLLTLVQVYPIYAIALDPAYRSIYLALSNGDVRRVSLYEINSKKHLVHIFELTNGTGIYTIPDDPDLKFSFVSLSNESKSHVTCIVTSFDGTSLVLGRSDGSVSMHDVVTRQPIKSFKSVQGPVSFLERFMDVVSENNVFKGKGNNYRAVPALQRSLGDGALEHYEIITNMPGIGLENEKKGFSQIVSEQSEYFRSISSQEITTSAIDDSDLSEKYKQLQAAYTKLFNAHNA